MHVVVLDKLSLYGAEGAYAHLQGYEDVRHLCENFRREVQAGGGGGDSALVLGVDSLIALFVCGFAFAVHVVGQS